MLACFLSPLPLQNQIQVFPQMYIAQPPGQRAFYPHQTFAATRPWHQNQMQGVRAPFYGGGGGGPSRNRPVGPRGGMNMGARMNAPRMPNQRLNQQPMGGQVRERERVNFTLD